MTEPALGLYYTFKYVGGRVYDPDVYDGEGMYVGKRGTSHLFATALPKRSAEVGNPIQDILITYTTMAYYPIRFPRDKVMITSETYDQLMKYIRSAEYKDPIDRGRTSPTLYIKSDTLIQQD